ncbi:glycosyltransferase family 2 protein [Metaclostridioides mangenotii]|uniref:glycosyltransferase family 2 protein n=1 Tax=Metaclostridioides mangenotii TaxID=1540 RepID=UPI00048956C7|nr:glycosyltransferase family A protein [Clostridioides mangenotii]
MCKYKITVFTATYNRAYLLENVYNGLKSQTLPIDMFEWLIIDDGSDDNTRELVEKFITEDKLNINYVYKENGGKHSAINVAMKHAKGELTFVLDSDDEIVEDALEIVRDEWDLIEDKSGFNGVIGLCAYPNGEVIGSKMPEDVKECPFADLFFKYGVEGDKTIIFVTDILKKFPFPEREGINFLPESVVWFEMSKFYKIKCVNKTLRKSDYLEDGLTKNMFRKKSLKGRALEFLILTNQNTYPINKYPYMWIKNYINLARYSLLSGSSHFKEINGFFNKFMYIIMFPLGFYKYWGQRKQVWE